MTVTSFYNQAERADLFMASIFYKITDSFQTFYKQLLLQGIKSTDSVHKYINNYINISVFMYSITANVKFTHAMQAWTN